MTRGHDETAALLAALRRGWRRMNPEARTRIRGPAVEVRRALDDRRELLPPVTRLLAAVHRCDGLIDARDRPAILDALQLAAGAVCIEDDSEHDPQG